MLNIRKTLRTAPLPSAHNRRTIETKRQATSIYRISLASKGIFPVPPFSVDRQDNDRIHHLGHHYSK